MAANTTHTGAMIALVVPDPENYAITPPTENSLAANDLHITIAYLGEANEIGQEEREAILDACQVLADTSDAPESLFPASTGVFPPDPESPEPDPKAAYYAAPAHAERFSLLREDLMTHLSARGVSHYVSTKHPVFTPHVTLTYDTLENPPSLNLPTPVPVTFPTLIVKFGDEIHTYHLRTVEAGPALPLTASARTKVSELARVSHYSEEYLTALFLRQNHVKGSSVASREDAALNVVRASVTPEAKVNNFPRLSAAMDRIKLAATDTQKMYLANRALALASKVEGSAVGTEARELSAITASLRTIIADGNSRAARSARARMQLRDRYGRWIFMGGSIRFKLRKPGTPGGGEWKHGTARGINIATGHVQVELEDGSTVSVPASKVEQTKATIGTKSGSTYTPFKARTQGRPNRATLPDESNRQGEEFRDAADDEAMDAIQALHGEASPFASRTPNGGNVIKLLTSDESRERIKEANLKGEDKVTLTGTSAPFKDVDVEVSTNLANKVIDSYEARLELNGGNRGEAIASLTGRYNDRNDEDATELRRAPAVQADEMEEISPDSVTPDDGADPITLAQAADILDDIVAEFDDASLRAGIENDARNMLSESLKDFSTRVRNGEMDDNTFLRAIDAAKEFAYDAGSGEEFGDVLDPFDSASEDLDDLYTSLKGISHIDQGRAALAVAKERAVEADNEGLVEHVENAEAKISSPEILRSTGPLADEIDSVADHVESEDGIDADDAAEIAAELRDSAKNIRGEGEDLAPTPEASDDEITEDGPENPDNSDNSDNPDLDDKAAYDEELAEEYQASTPEFAKAIKSSSNLMGSVYGAITPPDEGDPDLGEENSPLARAFAKFSELMDKWFSTDMEETYKSLDEFLGEIDGLSEELVEALATSPHADESAMDAVRKDLDTFIDDLIAARNVADRSEPEAEPAAEAEAENIADAPEENLQDFTDAAAQIDELVGDYTPSAEARERLDDLKNTLVNAGLDLESGRISREEAADIISDAQEAANNMFRDDELGDELNGSDLGDAIDDLLNEEISPLISRLREPVANANVADEPDAPAEVAEEVQEIPAEIPRTVPRTRVRPANDEDRVSDAARAALDAIADNTPESDLADRLAPEAAEARVAATSAFDALHEIANGDAPVDPENFLDAIRDAQERMGQWLDKLEESRTGSDLPEDQADFIDGEIERIDSAIDSLDEAAPEDVLDTPESTNVSDAAAKSLVNDLKDMGTPLADVVADSLQERIDSGTPIDKNYVDDQRKLLDSMIRSDEADPEDQAAGNAVDKAFEAMFDTDVDDNFDPVWEFNEAIDNAVNSPRMLESIRAQILEDYSLNSEEKAELLGRIDDILNPDVEDAPEVPEVPEDVVDESAPTTGPNAEPVADWQSADFDDEIDASPELKDAIDGVISALDTVQNEELDSEVDADVIAQIENAISVLNDRGYTQSSVTGLYRTGMGVLGVEHGAMEDLFKALVEAGIYNRPLDESVDVPDAPENDSREVFNRNGDLLFNEFGGASEEVNNLFSELMEKADGVVLAPEVEERLDFAGHYNDWMDNGVENTNWQNFLEVASKVLGSDDELVKRVASYMDYDLPSQSQDVPVQDNTDVPGMPLNDALNQAQVLRNARANGQYNDLSEAQVNSLRSAIQFFTDRGEMDSANAIQAALDKHLNGEILDYQLVQGIGDGIAYANPSGIRRGMAPEKLRVVNTLSELQAGLQRNMQRNDDDPNLPELAWTRLSSQMDRNDGLLNEVSDNEALEWMDRIPRMTIGGDLKRFPMNDSVEQANDFVRTAERKFRDGDREGAQQNLRDAVDAFDQVLADRRMINVNDAYKRAIERRRRATEALSSRLDRREPRIIRNGNPVYTPGSFNRDLNAKFLVGGRGAGNRELAEVMIGDTVIRMHGNDNRGQHGIVLGFKGARGNSTSKPSVEILVFDASLNRGAGGLRVMSVQASVLKRADGQANVDAVRDVDPAAAAAGVLREGFRMGSDLQAHVAEAIRRNQVQGAARNDGNVDEPEPRMPGVAEGGTDLYPEGAANRLSTLPDEAYHAWFSARERQQLKEFGFSAEDMENLKYARQNFVSADFLLDGNQTRAKAGIARAFGFDGSRTFGTKGYTIKLTGSSVSARSRTDLYRGDGPHKVFTISGEVLNADGTSIGTVTREIEVARDLETRAVKIHVHNSFMKFYDTEDRGSGFAKQFNGQIATWMNANHTETSHGAMNTIQAALETGGYVWAKFGFRFQDRVRSGVQRQAADYIESLESFWRTDLQKTRKLKGLPVGEGDIQAAYDESLEGKQIQELKKAIINDREILPADIMAVGWLPGMDDDSTESWLGKKVLLALSYNTGWEGQRDLRPITGEMRNMRNLSAEMKEVPNEDLIADQRTVAPSDLPDEHIAEIEKMIFDEQEASDFAEQLRPRDRMAISNFLYGNVSIASLGPALRTGVRTILSRNLANSMRNNTGSPEMLYTLAKLNRVAQQENYLRNPSPTNLGVGEALRSAQISTDRSLLGDEGVLSFVSSTGEVEDDPIYVKLPEGFSISGERIGERGINASNFFVTHDDTGEKFMMKLDTLSDGLQLSAFRNNADTERNVANLLRDSGRFPGMHMSSVMTSGPNDGEIPAISIQSVAGASLPGASTPRTAFEYEARLPESPDRGLADPTQMVDMLVLDAVTGNYDRHDANYMIASAPDAGNVLLPIDNSAGFAFTDTRDVTDRQIVDRFMSNRAISPTLRLLAQFGEAGFKNMVKDAIANYREVANNPSSEYANPEFLPRIQKYLDILERNIDTLYSRSQGHRPRFE